MFKIKDIFTDGHATLSSRFILDNKMAWKYVILFGGIFGAETTGNTGNLHMSLFDQRRFERYKI
jgi:hypothetical protein